MASAEAAATRVSALVVTYGHAEELPSCLDALLGQDVPGGLEVVVVDNASTDGTVEVLSGYGQRVRAVLRTSNAGFAAATNQAAATARGDVLVLVNPDCVVDAGCLAALVAHLDAQPRCGAAAALLRYLDGRPQLFARREPTVASTWWDLTNLGRALDRRRGEAGRRLRRYAPEFAELDQALAAGQMPPPLVVDGPAGACVAVRRRDVDPEHLGAVLDERFPLMFNDTDLWARLRERGLTCEVLPAATAAHGYGTSLRRVPSARMRAEYVASMREYAARWSVWRRLALDVLLLVDALYTGARGLRGPSRGRDRAWARGTLGGLGLPYGLPPWLTAPPRPGPWRRPQPTPPS